MGIARRQVMGIGVWLVCHALAAAQEPAGASSRSLAPGALGAVIMHGKGGSPQQRVAELAGALEREGWRVENLEMPWSARRQYDVGVAAAEQEVGAAVARLRQQGARWVFLMGHSQGAVFAVAMGSRIPVDGVVAMAPGGNVASPVFRDKLGESLERAEQALAQGQGDERLRLLDFENSRGTFVLLTTPRHYVDWFDPQGVMNQMAAMKRLPTGLPVLLVVPTGDYPGLQRVKAEVAALLPANPLSRLVEPAASHMTAPGASASIIAAWAAEVAASVR